MELAKSPEPSLAIVAQDLCYDAPTTAGTLPILLGIDLEIKAGEQLAIVGRSGSGKTTLLGLMAGLDVPTRGRVQLFGHDLSAMNEDQRAGLRAGRVGFVFQSFHLMPNLTALENVMLPLEISAKTDASDRALAYLRQVGLHDRETHYPAQLSGGEQQRVAIARAFATEPAILFADEPTGNLDTETGRQITDLLFELNAKNGTTLVLVTHDDALAARCQRRVRIHEGRLLAEAQP